MLAQRIGSSEQLRTITIMGCDDVHHIVSLPPQDALAQRLIAHQDSLRSRTVTCCESACGGIGTGTVPLCTSTCDSNSRMGTGKWGNESIKSRRSLIDALPVLSMVGAGISTRTQKHLLRNIIRLVLLTRAAISQLIDQRIIAHENRFKCPRISCYAN